MSGDGDEVDSAGLARMLGLKPSTALTARQRGMLPEPDARRPLRWRAAGIAALMRDPPESWLFIPRLARLYLLSGKPLPPGAKNWGAVGLARRELLRERRAAERSAGADGTTRSRAAPSDPGDASGVGRPLGAHARRTPRGPSNWFDD